MSQWALVLIVPFVVLVLAVGTIMIVALCRAAQSDIPTVLSTGSSVLVRLADKIPGGRLRANIAPAEAVRADDAEGIRTGLGGTSEGGIR